MIFFGERVVEEPEESELESELALSDTKPLLCLPVFVGGEIPELESESEDESPSELEELLELEESLELEDDEEELEAFFPFLLGRLDIAPMGGGSTCSFSSEDDIEQYSTLTVLPFTFHPSLDIGVQFDPGLV